MNEQKFIDAINAEHGEGVRLAEHVYADWLEEQCDPRSEAWRVLIQANRKPRLKIHEDLSLHLYSWGYCRPFCNCGLEGFVLPHCRQVRSSFMHLLYAAVTR